MEARSTSYQCHVRSWRLQRSRSGVLVIDQLLTSSLLHSWGSQDTGVYIVAAQPEQRFQAAAELMRRRDREDRARLRQLRKVCTTGLEGVRCTPSCMGRLSWLGWCKASSAVVRPKSVSCDLQEMRLERKARQRAAAGQEDVEAVVQLGGGQHDFSDGSGDDYGDDDEGPEERGHSSDADEEEQPQRSERGKSWAAEGAVGVGVSMSHWNSHAPLQR
jgi:hypothetical protein